MSTGGHFTPAALLVQRGQITTDAAGIAVWTFPTAFPAPPRLVFSLGPSADGALLEARITAVSTTSVTVAVRRAPSVSVVGVAVLGAPQPAPGVPVQFVAVPA